MFYTRGQGYYEQYKAEQSYSSYGLPDPVYGVDTLHETDLIRQLWLDNNFFGNNFSLQYKKSSTDIIIGGGWSRYLGNHFGNVFGPLPVFRIIIVGMISMPTKQT
jgi:iron complex outermembrane receptor protein